uniref:Uncharacterized protein n=1 Tax=Anguilla anguilla TaxID=7936 RepID=A0A0E9Q096_ANGAN
MAKKNSHKGKSLSGFWPLENNFVTLIISLKNLSVFHSAFKYLHGNFHQVTYGSLILGTV